MPYKTILVHLDGTEHDPGRVRIAAEIARANDAHLIGAAMIGASTRAFDMANVSENAPSLANHLDFLRNRAIQAVERFEQEVERAGGVSYEGRAVDGDAGQGISLQARYSDLVVVGQSDKDDKNSIVAADFSENVLLHSGRPVLIIPNEVELDSVGKRILIAWDASLGATRAVTDAIPMLQRAEIVHLAVFNPDAYPERHGERPGDDVALYLARHGVNIEVQQRKTTREIGSAILSLADELSSDLIVMGGYGQSRFRQMLLGGVTRTVLEEMRISVMMSH